jgi:hypothetical protein
MRKLIAVMATVTIVTTLAACENDAGEGLRGQTACLTTPSPIADPGLPSLFPQINDFTWTSSQKAGPSLIVTGYSGDALEDVYREMQDHFETRGYHVVKKERDPHDAEVNFAGANDEGQVRLSEECQGRTALTITIRPKS